MGSLFGGGKSKSSTVGSQGTPNKGGSTQSDVYGNDQYGANKFIVDGGLEALRSLDPRYGGQPVSYQQGGLDQAVLSSFMNNQVKPDQSILDAYMKQQEDNRRAALGQYAMQQGQNLMNGAPVSGPPPGGPPTDGPQNPAARLMEMLKFRHIDPRDGVSDLRKTSDRSLSGHGR